MNRMIYFRRLTTREELFALGSHGLDGEELDVSEMADSLHVLVKPGETVAADLAALGPYTERGSTPHFIVYYDNSLGANGQALADAVLAKCEADYRQLVSWFGGVVPGGLPFTIYIDPGSFGAYHANCAATELHLAAFGGTNGDLVNMVNVAEADEVMMAAQNAGWNCGASAGEGLSRVLATERYPAQLDGFASAASWLDGGRPDWVNTTEATDRDYVSIGCATLFINYLVYQLGLNMHLVVQAGGTTLAQTYKNLTGSADALGPFAALLQQRFPVGTPSGLTTDNPYPLAQVGWRWCHKCQGMFFGGNPGSICPAGGSHDATGSGNYALATQAAAHGQHHWRWCHKCQGLFFGDNPGSVCPAGGAHDATGSGDYALIDNDLGFKGQQNWRWCHKCQGLFFGGNPGPVCPAGGAHDATGSGNYAIVIVPSVPGQDNWRWCHKCQGLFFGGNPGPVCPAGGAHDSTGSGNYVLVNNIAGFPGQHSWRWCHKCQGLFFGGNPSPVCPAGGAHDAAGSGNYALIDNDPGFPGQHNWRWCHKCQGLFFGGNPGPVCPAGGAHDSTGSGDYALAQK